MNENKRSLSEEIKEGFKSLESMRNNEPYIWMDDLGTTIGNEYYKELDDYLKDGLFPLYTHPVKELTNAEIMDIGDKYLVSAFVPYESLQFARAILRKAQEK